jgi:hypothetical protein
LTLETLIPSFGEEEQRSSKRSRIEAGYDDIRLPASQNSRCGSLRIATCGPMPSTIGTRGYHRVASNEFKGENIFNPAEA